MELGIIGASSSIPERHTKREHRSHPESSELKVPLVVDLDRTLVKTDLLLESIVTLLHREPRYLVSLPFWCLRGEVALKEEVACRVSLDARLVPYRSELLAYLQQQHSQGRHLVLATDSSERLAQSIADYLGIFDGVLAIDGSTPLSGEHKRERLVGDFGHKGFDYAGHGGQDLPVWPSARRAIVVSSNDRLVQALAPLVPIQSVFHDRPTRFEDYLTALRPQQWLKNLLVLAPLLLAHRFYEPLLFGRAIIVFIAFCCCASSGYLVNDLFDVAADRRHPTKRLRPFAAGFLPLSYALIMIPVLAVLGCALGALVGPSVLGLLLLYYALTVAYSVYIKRVVLLDVTILAALYTLRIIAGAAAVTIWLSGWLLAFSSLMFFSLAIAKRHVELTLMRAIDGNHASARSYKTRDAELLASAGIASGYMAVLVFLLYITTDAVNGLYGGRDWVWFLCPLLLYWVSHIWLQAHRRKIHDDPFVFALRDSTSRVLILLMIVTALLSL
jgi:4-hydroxybenzoate polyprenyltransferase